MSNITSACLQWQRPAQQREGGHEQCCRAVAHLADAAVVRAVLRLLQAQAGRGAALRVHPLQAGRPGPACSRLMLLLLRRQMPACRRLLTRPTCPRALLLLGLPA